MGLRLGGDAVVWERWGRLLSVSLCLSSSTLCMILHFDIGTFALYNVHLYLFITNRQLVSRLSLLVESTFALCTGLALPFLDYVQILAFQYRAPLLGLPVELAQVGLGQGF